MRRGLFILSRALTFFLPILAASGTNLLPIPFFGYTLSAFRLLVPVVLLSALILHPSLPTIRKDLPTDFSALIAFWLLFGLASLLWTPNRSLGIAELLSIATGGIVAFCLGVFQIADPRTIDFLRRGWAFALCAMYLVITWELMTGHHLQGSFVLQNEMIEGEAANLGVQGTLDNPNDLAAFAVFSAPFVIWSMLRAHKAIKIVGLGALVLSIGALAVFTGARLSLLTFAAQLIIFSFQSKKHSGRVLLLGVMALSVIAGALLVMSTTLQKLSELKDQMIGSDTTPIRRNLLLNGGEFLVKSYGWGIGAGGYTGAISQGAGTYPTGNSTITFVNPHAGIIEVSQYGLPVLIWVLVFLFVMSRKLWHCRIFALTTNRESLYLSTEVGLVSLLGLMILSFEGSVFLTDTVNWMFVASVLVHGTLAESCLPRSHAITPRFTSLRTGALTMRSAPGGAES